MYCKVPKTLRLEKKNPQSQSNSHNLISETEKYWESLKEINRIWKNHQNIEIIPAILGNGTSIPPYSTSDTSVSFKKPLILSIELENIKTLWKKLIEPEIKNMKILEKHTQYWEMVHPSYPNKRYRKAPTTVRHTDKKLKNTKLAPATKNIKNPCQKSRECCYCFRMTAAFYYLRYNLESFKYLCLKMSQPKITINKHHRK